MSDVDWPGQCAHRRCKSPMLFVEAERARVLLDMLPPYTKKMVAAHAERKPPSAAGLCDSQLTLAGDVAWERQEERDPARSSDYVKTLRVAGCRGPQLALAHLTALTLGGPRVWGRNVSSVSSDINSSVAELSWQNRVCGEAGENRCWDSHYEKPR